MFNSVTLVGRLAAGAELGRLSNAAKTPRVRVTVTVERAYDLDGETPVDFWPCRLVGEPCLRLAPYLSAGRLVLVSGAACLDSAPDGAGESRVQAYVSVRQVRFLDRRPPHAAGQ